jgi:hypothetical protein
MSVSKQAQCQKESAEKVEWNCGNRKKKFFKKDGHGCKKALRQLRVVGRIDFL